VGVSYFEFKYPYDLMKNAGCLAGGDVDEKNTLRKLSVVFNHSVASDGEREQRDAGVKTLRIPRFAL